MITTDANKTPSVIDQILITDRKLLTVEIVIKSKPVFDGNGTYLYHFHRLPVYEKLDDSGNKWIVKPEFIFRINRFYNEK